MRSPKFPATAERVASYGELEKYLSAFANGHLNLLLIVGRPGLCKSRLIVSAAKDLVLLSGKNSPIQTYISLYAACHKRVIIDDAESLYTNKDGKYLLRQLTESETVKTLSWNTSAKQLEEANVPTTFKTTSKVCIICNRWVSVNEITDAIEDRAHILYFDPTSYEVHAQIATWKQSNITQDIFDFIGGYCHLLPENSVRLYTKAVEKRAAGLDWKAYILSHCVNGATKAVLDLERDETIPSKKRVKEFIRLTKMSRATYFNLKKDLIAKGLIGGLAEAPKLKLKAKPEAAPDLKAIEEFNRPPECSPEEYDSDD